MANQLYQNKTIIRDGTIFFLPSGSLVQDYLPVVPFTSASYEITCSANTNGNLAPVDQTGSFFSFSSYIGRRVVLLYTTASNSTISASKYIPKSINKPYLKIITASINHGDNATAVATATFTAISKSISADYTAKLQITPEASHSQVIPSYDITQNNEKLLITTRRPGESQNIIFNSELTSSYGFVLKNRSTGSGTSERGLPGTGTPDIGQSSIQLGLTGIRSRDFIVSSSNGNILFVSESGKIGVGTTDPKTQFDLRSTSDSPDGTKLILRSARTSTPLEEGDVAGEINFIIESGSFGELQDSGSIAKFKGEVVAVNKSGARGKLVLSIAKDPGTGPLDVIEWQYAKDGTAGFAQAMSASLFIKDFNAGIPSYIRMTKNPGGALYMQATTGSLYLSKNMDVSGTGSFGLIEGGTF